MIEIKDIHKSFGKKEVLRGVDLNVKDGETVVILGPSGSGKTTLLRSIVFLEKADAGTMIFDGKEIEFARATRRDVSDIRKRTSVVFQNFNLFNNKTALENVMAGLTIARKVPRKEAEERAKNALNQVGLSERYNYYPSQLSGGQQQRVAIARSVAINPEIILFDEPTSALDPELIGETLKLLKQVAQAGITMLVVTHEMSFAEEVASKVVFMDNGIVVEEGDPKQIFEHPKEERTKQFLQRIIKEPEYFL